MKSIINLKRRGWKGKVFILAMAFFMTTCVSFEGGIDGPESAQAGETVTFTVHPYFKMAENRTNARMIIGFLAPKRWEAANNTTVTYTSNVDDGVQTMSLVPENVLAEYSDKNGHGKVTWKQALTEDYGVGPNVLEGMEWIVYQTDKTYTVFNEEQIRADVKVQVKVGPQNMRVKLGFFLAESADGTKEGDFTAIMYTDCFEVTDGEGDIIDFCELHVNAIQPVSATQEDIVTVSFQGDIRENDLQGAEAVYLCATAYTDGGHSYVRCNFDEKSKMKKSSLFGNNFEMSLWPKAYFGIPEGETITKIQYSFTNEDGSIEVMGDMGDDDEETWAPFTYTLRCN